MTRRAALSASFGLIASLACTAHEPAPPRSEVEPAVEFAVDAPPPAPLAQVPIAVEAKPEQPPQLVGSPIVHTRATTAWRELPGMDSVVRFHPFIFGVLAICGPGKFDDICKLRDDDTLELTSVEFPEIDEFVGEEPVMVGNWRSDAWLVTHEATNVTVQEDERGDINYVEKLVLRKLRTDKWFPSPVDGQKRIEDDNQLIRKAWAGGMLVYDRTRFIRVPVAGPPAPNLGATRAGKLVDFFESSSGTLYTVVEDGVGKVWVQRPCESQDCVTANAFPLAEGHWNFRVDAPRGEASISVIAGYRKDDDPAPDYLLHFDAGIEGGRWQLDEWPSDPSRPLPTMLWPDTHEGVWVAAGDALWYRDAAGDWFDVELPFTAQPGDQIGFANRMKPREFLVLLVREGVGRVFATKGLPRAP